MSDTFPTRRHVLALGLAVPALGYAGGASAGTSAQARIGAALLAEKGQAAGRALLAANRARIGDAAALATATVADFRARRTVTVGGVLLAEAEAADCVRAALGRAA